MKKFRRQRNPYQIFTPRGKKNFSNKGRTAYLRLVVVFIILISFSAVVYLKGIDFIAYYSSLWQNQSSTLLVTPKDTEILSPQLNSLPLAIKEDEELTVGGRLIEGSQVVIRVNEQEVVELKADAEGKFETVLRQQISEGNNTITAIALDQQGRRSKPSSSQSVLLDTQPPELEVSSPEEGAMIEDQKGIVWVAGKTESSKIAVTINDSRVIVDLEGNFGQNRPLAEGENVIVVKAQDEVGHETIVERKVTYSPSGFEPTTPTP